MLREQRTEDSAVERPGQGEERSRQEWKDELSPDVDADLVMLLKKEELDFNNRLSLF